MLNAKRPNCLATPSTLGEHLRRKRSECGLSQKDLGKRFGVSAATILLWENDRFVPEARYFPTLRAFLGYDPLPQPETLPERIKRHRLMLGLSQEKAAKRIGVSEQTLIRWETGEDEPLLKRRELEEFFRMQAKLPVHGLRHNASTTAPDSQTTSQ